MNFAVVAVCFFKYQQTIGKKLHITIQGHKGTKDQIKLKIVYLEW
jgi:hypothetical protein